MNKEMTKEEALEFLKNKKILCKNEKESLEVQNKFLELQKKLLNLDCIWRTTNKIYYLFFLEGINVLTPVENYKDWVEASREELKVQYLLDIKIKEEQKPKFDPHILIDFQKVLCRYSNTDLWRLGFFEYYNETQNNKFWIIGQDAYPFEQCVPYNEETKHLHKTNNEAPEYYKTWK